MNSFFNKKLYFEGLKKVKVLGIACAIVITVLCAIVPLTQIIASTIELSNGTELRSSVITVSSFAVPLIAIMGFTPFFMYSMFSFLNKRNESDFYHSVPFKRTAVYFSFALAAFTWIWGIILLAGTVAGLLWVLTPCATTSFSAFFLTIAEYIVVSLFIGSISLFAVSTTGTRISGIGVTAIFLFCIRVCFLEFVLCIEGLNPIFSAEDSLLSILTIRYWMPGAIIGSLFNASMLKNIWLWIYTIAVSAVFLAIAAICYKNRKSEMACQSAPGKAMQTLNLCLFSLPFFLTISTTVIMEESISLAFVCLNSAMLVFFLYQLITTKSIKAVGKSMPFAAVLIGCSVLFVLGIFVTNSIILSQKYDASDIRSVGISDNTSIFSSLYSSYNSDYESIRTGGITVEDEKAKTIVSNALTMTIESFKTDGTIAYVQDGSQVPILIELSSGRTIKRNIYISQENYQQLLAIISGSSEYLEEYLKLPTDSEAETFSASDLSSYKESDLKKIYQIFRNEYSGLTEEEQVKYKSDNEGSGWYNTDDFSIRLRVAGSYDGKTFSSVYKITSDFPLTIAAYQEMIRGLQEKAVDMLTDFVNGSYDSMLSQPSYANDFTLNISGLKLNPSADSESYYISFDSYYDSENFDTDSLKQLIQSLLPYIEYSVSGQSAFSINISVSSENSDFSYVWCPVSLKEIPESTKAIISNYFSNLHLFENSSVETIDVA